MAKYSLGLVNIYLAPTGAGNGYGTAYEAVGSTVTDSATMSTADDTVTDIKIEESSTPIISYISDPGKTTFAWSTYDVSPYTLYRLFGGTLAQFKTASGLGTVVPGSGYTNGTYYDVPLTGGAGSGAKGTVVVSGGVVSSVAIVNGGEGYAVSDSLTASNTNLGGTGSGFSVPVATLANSSATKSVWNAPAQKITLQKSLKIVSKLGSTLEIANAQISARFNASFSGTKASQIDMTASILLPDDGSSPYRVTS
jgi:hypothetical protein